MKQISTHQAPSIESHERSLISIISEEQKNEPLSRQDESKMEEQKSDVRSQIISTQDNKEKEKKRRKARCVINERDKEIVEIKTTKLEASV